VNKEPHGVATSVEAPLDDVWAWISDPNKFRTLYPSWIRRVKKVQRAEGLIDFGELREMLSELDEDKKVAEREIESLQKKEERLDAIRCNKDALLTNMVEMTPRLIDELAPEEKHRIYGMLDLRLTTAENGSLEVAGDLTDLSFGEQIPRCPSRY
jgi:hypothetical protein